MKCSFFAIHYSVILLLSWLLCITEKVHVKEKDIMSMRYFIRMKTENATFGNIANTTTVHILGKNMMLRRMIIKISRFGHVILNSLVFDIYNLYVVLYVLRYSLKSNE